MFDLVINDDRGDPEIGMGTLPEIARQLSTLIG